jgi:hypothetical protein
MSMWEGVFSLVSRAPQRLYAPESGVGAPPLGLSGWPPAGLSSAAGPRVHRRRTRRLGLVESKIGHIVSIAGTIGGFQHPCA